MSGTAFLILCGSALLLSAGCGLLLLPRSEKPPPAPRARWAVYLLHPRRLLSGEGPAVEGPPGGPSFSPLAPFDPRFPRLRLREDGGRRRIEVQRRFRIGRMAFVARTGGRFVAEVRAPRRAGAPPEVLSPGMELSLSGYGPRLELELRRAGKLVASSSPSLSACRGAVGVEVLSAEDPLPHLAVMAALAVVEELMARAGTGAAAATA